MSHRRNVSLQSFEHFDHFLIISMVAKSTDHGHYCPKHRQFLMSVARPREKNKLPHHHVISMVCTLIKHRSPPTSGREIVQLL